MWSSFPPIRSNSSASSPFSSTFHYVIIRRSRVPINLHPTRSCVRFPFLSFSFLLPRSMPSSAPFSTRTSSRLISHSLPSFSSSTISVPFPRAQSRSLSFHPFVIVLFTSSLLSALSATSISLPRSSLSRLSLLRCPLLFWYEQLD